MQVWVEEWAQEWVEEGVVDNAKAMTEAQIVELNEMGERVVVPVLNEEGEDSRLSPHFGRAPYFAVAEVEKSGQIQSLEFQPNRSSHFGGQERPPDVLLSFKPNIVITYGMGPRALRAFQAAGVAVLQATIDTLGGVLKAFVRDELVELTEGCREARHR